MEGNFYSMSEELSSLLVDTHRLLGVLEGMVAFIPEKYDLANMMLLRESSYSRMIDYPDFDFLSFLTKRATSSPDIDIQNIISAYHYAMETPTSKLSFNNIVNLALHGDDHSNSITVRTTQKFLSKTTMNFRQYNPTSPEKIRSALFDITKYMESNYADVLVKAAMCHYQFEMIHPYERYNGIVGRVLPYHIMCNTKLNTIRFLCPSASLFVHRAEYFDKLASTQKSGNYTNWIEFFIRIINEAADKSVAFIRHYHKCMCNDENRILSYCKDKRDSTPEVYRYFRQHIVSDIQQISKHLNLSYATVSRSVSILQDFGLLTQVNQSARNRVFAYESILQHLV
jgi:Fic family protein